MPVLPTSIKIVCPACHGTVHPRRAHVCNARPVGTAS